MRAEQSSHTAWSRHLTYLSALPLVLAGCATNPMVEWQPQAEPAGKLDTMETARADADSLKQAFHSKASVMVGNKAALNDGLLGLGILTLGLATGGAHKDAYLATSGLAGSSYLFGNANLQPSVLSAYQSGIGAVNCAIGAVRPLQVTQSEMAQVTEVAMKLRAELVVLATAIAQVEVDLANLPTHEAELRALASGELKDTRELYQRGQAASGQAAVLPAAVTRAAGLLKGSLAEIHRTTNEWAAKGVADSSSVMDSLKSLVSVVSGFAPGLGLDTLLNKRIDSIKAGSLPSAHGNPVTHGGNGAPPPSAARSLAGNQLALSLQTMATARAKTAVWLEPLSTQLTRYSSFDGHSELTACKIDPSVGMLAVDRKEIAFTTSVDTDQSSRFVVRGGTKPYKGAFRDSPTQGIEVVNPIAFDSAFEVKVPKATPAGVQLVYVVSDAASPPNEQLVKISVAAAAVATSATEAENQNRLRLSENLGSALKRVVNRTFTVPSADGLGMVTLKVTKHLRDDFLHRVEVICTPKVPATPLHQTSVKAGLLDELVKSHGLNGSIKNDSGSLIEVKAQPSCMQ